MSNEVDSNIVTDVISDTPLDSTVESRVYPVPEALQDDEDAVTDEEIRVITDLSDAIEAHISCTDASTFNELVGLHATVLQTNLVVCAMLCEGRLDLRRVDLTMDLLQLHDELRFAMMACLSQTMGSLATELCGYAIAKGIDVPDHFVRAPMDTDEDDTPILDTAEDDDTVSEGTSDHTYTADEIEAFGGYATADYVGSDSVASDTASSE